MPATARPIVIVITGTSSATMRCTMSRACSSWISAARNDIAASCAASSPSCNKWIVRAGNSSASANGRARPRPPFASIEAASTAALAARLPSASLTTASAGIRGTPFCNKVPSVRVSRAATVSRSRRPTKGRRNRSRSSLSRSAGTTNKRGTATAATRPSTSNHGIAAPTTCPRTISARVEAGNWAPACSKIGANCGST